MIPVNVEKYGRSMEIYLELVVPASRSIIPDRVLLTEVMGGVQRIKSSRSSCERTLTLRCEVRFHGNWWQGVEESGYYFFFFFFRCFFPTFRFNEIESTETTGIVALWHLTRSTIDWRSLRAIESTIDDPIVSTSTLLRASLWK